MKKYLLSIIFVLLVITFGSCGTTKTVMEIDHNEENSPKVQNIVLLSTMLGKIDEASMSKLDNGYVSGIIGALVDAIDAGSINDDIEALSDSIINFKKQMIDKYNVTVANSLRNNFKCNVLYSDSLFFNKGFAEIKKKYNLQKSLNTGDLVFPEIVLAGNQINCFDFESGDVIKYFNDEDNYKRTIADIATLLNSDIVAISYSRLNMIGDCVLKLDTYLYFFDKNGTLLTKAFNATPNTKIECDDIKYYKRELEKFSTILDPMVKKVASDYKKMN